MSESDRFRASVVIRDEWQVGSAQYTERLLTVLCGLACKAECERSGHIVHERERQRRRPPAEYR